MCHIPDSMNKKIILLEDDFDTNEIITLVFEPEGFEVITSKVASLHSDIELINPDVIISDYRLGESKTGADLCKELKADSKTAKIPFILTSAVNDLPTIAFECNADGYIEKPFDIANIVFVVRGLLRK